MNKFRIIAACRELVAANLGLSTSDALGFALPWVIIASTLIPSSEQRQGIRCPTFLFAASGPWLTVLGSVFTDKYIIQHMTDLRMVLSSTEENDRIYHNARVLVALRDCIEDLREFYMTLNNLNSKSPPFVPNQPHPRYFPYPTSSLKTVP